MSGLEPGAFHLVAAALRADAADVASLARVLGTTLGDRVAGREGTVRAVRVLAPERVLELRAGRGAATAEIRQVVRGVTISRRQVGIDEFVDALATELTAVAERDAAARAALERVLGLA